MKCLEHKTDTKTGGNGVSLFFYVQSSDHLSCRHESCVFSGLEKTLEATYHDLELPFNCRFQNVSDSTYKKTSMIWHLHQIISFFHHDGPCFLFISAGRLWGSTSTSSITGTSSTSSLEQFLSFPSRFFQAEYSGSKKHLRWIPSVHTNIRYSMIFPYHPCIMYGIFTFMYHKKQPNVGEYTIHGCYGIDIIWTQHLYIPCCYRIFWTPHVFFRIFMSRKPSENQWKFLAGDFHFHLSDVFPHNIHEWYIYLHLVDFCGKWR